MVRRAASNATDDSLKENSGRRPATEEKHTKTRRGTLQGHAENEEESQINNNGNAREPLNSDHHDTSAAEEEDEEEEEGSGSPKGRKRARANTLGDSRPTDGEMKGKKKAVTLPRDVDG